MRLGWEEQEMQANFVEETSRQLAIIKIEQKLLGYK
jgi:hypothetical protein